LGISCFIYFYVNSISFGVSGIETEGDIYTDGSLFTKNYLFLAPMNSAWGAPTTGQIYFNNSDKHFYGYNGEAWKKLDN